MTDDFYRVFGGEQREGAIVVSQFDEPVDYSPMLSGRVANIVPVDDIDQVTRAVNAYTQTIGIYPESLKHQLRDTLPLFGAQRLTSLGYACSVAIAMPQDAIEPIRRMCKWIVDEECDPEVVIPLWRLGSAGLPRSGSEPGRAAQERAARTHPGRGVRIVPEPRCFGHEDRRDLRARRHRQSHLLQPLPHPPGHGPRPRREPAGQPARRGLRAEATSRSHSASSAYSTTSPATLVDSGETYREMIGEMMAAADYGAQRGSPFHETFVELVKDGLARGEIHTRHDPQIVADIIVGALSGAIVNWRVDTTYSLPTNLHNLGLALADLLVADG